MMLFFGALVLNLMVFFNEIEASGLRRVSTMPYQNDREGIDHLITSRRPTQSSSTYNNLPLQAHRQSFSTHDPPALANEFLNLNAPTPYSPEYFHQQIHGHHFYPQEPLRRLNPAETSNLVYKYNFKNGRLPDPMDYQEPKHSQEYSRLGNVEWLLHQTQEAQREYQEASSLVLDESMASYKNVFSSKPRSAKQEMIQEEKPKKQRAVRIREPVSSQNNVEESAMNDHATGEIARRGRGKAPVRKGVSESRFKAEAEGRRNIVDSHDPFVQQSQSSEHQFQNSYPVSIPSRKSAFNPYIRLPQNDPNDPQNWKYPGGTGSNYKK